MKSDNQRPTRTPNKGSANQQRSNLAVFALVGQVGLFIGGGIALGTLLGVFIDKQLHSSPVATLIGLLLGLAAGIYGVYRLVSNLE